jgi:hypothetical protein
MVNTLIRNIAVWQARREAPRRGRHAQRREPQAVAYGSESGKGSAAEITSRTS